MNDEPAITILHRDHLLIVIDKPVGLLSVPGIGPAKRDSVAVRLAEQFEGARIVHRLDRDTSGAMVLALDAATHRELSRQFHDREVEKVYSAIVAGQMEKESGEIDLPMRKDMDPRPGNVPRHIIDFAQGREAITRWRVLETAPGSSRLELRPLTGRSHQLRVHLDAIGHPILGDDLYGPASNKDAAARLMLHAASLTITHPGSGERVTYESICPF